MEYFLVAASVIAVYSYVRYLVSKHEQEDRHLQNFNNRKMRGFKRRGR